jgi:hypothetical protein
MDNINPMMRDFQQQQQQRSPRYQHHHSDSDSDYNCYDDNTNNDVEVDDDDTRQRPSPPRPASFVKSLMSGEVIHLKKEQQQQQRRRRRQKTKTTTTTNTSTLLSPSSFLTSTIGACTGITTTSGGGTTSSSYIIDSDPTNDDKEDEGFEYRYNTNNDYHDDDEGDDDDDDDDGRSSSIIKGYDCYGDAVYNYNNDGQLAEKMDDIIIKLSKTALPLTKSGTCRTLDNTTVQTTDSVLILNSTDNATSSTNIIDKYRKQLQLQQQQQQQQRPPNNSNNHRGNNNNSNTTKQNNKNNKINTTKNISAARKLIFGGVDNSNTTKSKKTNNATSSSPFLNQCRCEGDDDDLSSLGMEYDIEEYKTDNNNNNNNKTARRTITATTMNNSSKSSNFLQCYNNNLSSSPVPHSRSLMKATFPNNDNNNNSSTTLYAPAYGEDDDDEVGNNDDTNNKNINDNSIISNNIGSNTYSSSPSQLQSNGGTSSSNTNGNNNNNNNNNNIGGSHREIQYWRQRLHHATKYYGKTHTATADAYFNLGQAQLKVQYSSKRKQHQYDLSVENLTIAHQIWERKYGPHHVAVGRALDALALAVVRRANHNKSTAAAATGNKNSKNDNVENDLRYAQRLLEQAFAIRHHHLGVWHVDTVESYNKLASVYLHLGKIREACDAYREVFLVRRSIFGPDHPSVAITSHSIANCHYKLREIIDSLKWYQISLDIYETMKLPYRHPTVAKLLKDRSRLERYME